MVRHAFGRLNGSNIGVNQNGLDTFLVQRFEGLRTRIIELARLTDLQGAGAKNQHFMNILKFHVVTYLRS